MDGDVLDPDVILDEYKDWRDESSYPTTEEERVTSQIPVSSKFTSEYSQAFCEVYSVEDAIETFLSDIYSKTESTGRYRYAPSDSEAGLVIYGDHAYSHHTSDPAHGERLNAYDLVRIHMFGDLDKGVHHRKKPSNYPSVEAMRKLSKDHPQIHRQIVLSKINGEEPNSSNGSLDWTSGLKLNSKAELLSTDKNYELIIEHDEALQALKYNVLTDKVCIEGEVPWERRTCEISAYDKARLKSYFVDKYDLNEKALINDALLSITGQNRPYHPIKQYLEGLEWDGVPRVEALLPSFLGAEDTQYTREVTKKTLSAAVQRVYKPGIKFDTVLVLAGPQGVGKSTLVEKLGKKWFSDSLTFYDIRDKTGYEKLQGGWIFELSELNGLDTTDRNAIKRFLSSTEDKYRKAYAEHAEKFPRSSIFIGTTNEIEGFLNDPTGGRRFWPVKVGESAVLNVWEMTTEYIDQIWAEVMSELIDEPLFLGKDLAPVAIEVQNQYQVFDEWEGFVQEYLEILLPEDWKDWDLEARRKYVRLPESQRTGSIRRDKVCVSEIRCEYFGRSIGSKLNRRESNKITSILSNLVDWEKSDAKESKLRFNHYGVQKAFVRKNSF